MSTQTCSSNTCIAQAYGKRSDACALCSRVLIVAQVFLTNIFGPGSPCHDEGSNIKERGGNSAPKIRLPFPPVPQEALGKAWNSYCRAMGIKQAFNLCQYKRRSKLKAFKAWQILHNCLLQTLLEVSSCAKIKYRPCSNPLCS